ncbi:MAG: hypothetical protein IJT72_01325, partial [Lachnospiraceae bacterium]|nr:hypothetical protein [Lachnospiraceae bacterium]
MKYIKKYRKIIALLLVFVFVTNDMHIALAGNVNFINDENIKTIENIDIDSDIEDSDIENTESEEDDSAALELEESEMPLTTPLYEDMEIDGNITLDEDMVINNLILNEKAVLNLNGYVLTVMGNAELNGGTLEFNNGILTCENDVDIDRKVTVKMDKINDRLVVKGNLHVYGMSASSGTVSLYGDFIADSTVRLSDNNKFVFEGNEKQTISINTESNFNILELKNFSEEGIFIDYALKYNQLIDNNCIVTYNDLDGARGFKLEEDTQIDGMFYLTIDKLDLNGYTLTVNGDFIQAGGEVDLNNGTLIVKGDYVVARLVKDEINEDGETTYNYEAGNGTLTMDDANDYLLVEGSYVNNKNNNRNVTLTEGVMEVKGDFNAKYLCASGNHTLTFSGEEKQNIDMNYTSFSSYNHYIKNLNFQNTSDEGIILSKDLNVCGCIRQNNTKVDGRLVIYSSVTFPENRYTGDLYIYNLNCTAPMTVYGDVEIDSMTVNNGMDIYGDVTVKSLALYDDVNIYGNISGGTVSLRGSNIYVKGDSLNTYYSDYTNTENTVMIDGNVSLNGSSLDDSELTVKKDISTSKETDIKKLVLCGDEKQKISNAYYFNLGTLVLENYSEEGIHADNIIHAEEIISNELSITYDNFDDAISGWTLEKDEVYDGDLVMIGGELNLNG